MEPDDGETCPGNPTLTTLQGRWGWDWGELPVSGNAWEETVEAIEANLCLECEKLGKPESFRRQSRLGKPTGSTGFFSAHSLPAVPALPLGW